MSDITGTNEQLLVQELSTLIEQSQQQMLKQVNSIVNLLFWQLGKRVNDYVLQNKRADYGKQIVVTLSRQ